MKKIWITGAEGHIGTALLDLLEGVEYQLLPTDIEEVDITKIDEVTQFVHVNRPDVVINCAGLTDVQECENNVDEAYRVNAIGVRNVALAANEVNAKVIQISTDDVFDKESRVPYNEFDNVHPRTIYGKSKEAGEKILTQLLNRFVITEAPGSMESEEILWMKCFAMWDRERRWKCRTTSMRRRPARKNWRR